MRAFAPVFWLVGKVRGGKTRRFEFPGEMPTIRFLDARGVGEAGCEPSGDIAFCENRSHLVVAVAKAAGMEQQSALSVLAAFRIRHPDWPIVAARTALHELYPAGEPRALVAPSLESSVRLDFLGFCLVDVGERVARFHLYAEQLVELGVQRLRVAMLRTLYEEGDESGDDQPRDAEQHQADECGRARRQCAKPRQETP